uniref:Putative glutamate-gated kainate-type ion channel receptor subunit glur5 n=1 Tax=Ixodes scapularis TaxID=6945 RepID=A0A4D5S6K8_IXOSC
MLCSNVALLLLVSAGLSFSLMQHVVELHPSQLETVLRSQIQSENAHIVLVSCKGFWDDVDLFWMKLLPVKASKWLYDEPGLRGLLVSNTMYSFHTTVLVPSPRNSTAVCLEQMQRSYVYRYMVKWIFLSLEEGIEPSSYNEAKNETVRNSFSFRTPETSLLRATQSVGTPSETLRESSIRRKNGPTPRFLENRNKLRSLSGQHVRIGFINNKYFGTFNDSLLLMHVLSLLRATNATLHFHRHTNFIQLISEGLAEGSIDVFIHKLFCAHVFLAYFDFPNILLYDYPTFYAKANATRVLTPGDIFANSSVTIILFILSFCLYLLILCLIDYVQFRAFRTVSRAAFFLLGIFCAASSVIPNTTRWKGIRRSLFAVWLFSILPLSTYFQGQLTSWFTTNVPENVLDTLEELQEALESDSVAPCVVDQTLVHYILQRTATKSDTMNELRLNPKFPRLMLKLMESFSRHQEDNLVTRTFADCVLCARRNDRVCFADQVEPCVIKPVSRDVRMFKEHYNHHMMTTLVGKNSRLKSAYGTFLQRLHESSLLHNRSRFKCEYQAEQTPAPPTVQLELWGFFRFYAMILSATAIVWLLELCVSL